MRSREEADGERAGDVGGRGWIGEGARFGAVASASGEEGESEGGAGKVDVAPLGRRRREGGRVVSRTLSSLGR